MENDEIGIPDTVGIAIDGVGTTQSVLVDALTKDTKPANVGSIFGWGTSLAFGGDIIGAAKNGNAGEVKVQTAGLVGSLSGGEAGAALGAKIGKPFGKVIQAITTIAGSVIGAWKGEHWVEDLMKVSSVEAMRGEINGIASLNEAIHNSISGWIRDRGAGWHVTLRELIDQLLEYTTDATPGAITPGLTITIETPSGTQTVNVMDPVETPMGPQQVWSGSHYDYDTSSGSQLGGGEGAANNGHGPTGSTTGSAGSGGTTVTGQTTSQTTYSSGGTTQTATSVTGGGGGGADSGQAANPEEDPTASEGRRPILLDLDGNGVKITEFDKSSQFVAGKDGLQHRTSWAGAGDGVLFFDPDGRNAITEERQYVFTEWDPTASGDLEAIRSTFDSNGDGKLTAADADFAKFKVMVTNADGSTTVKTLAELGITEIDLTANAVNIGMPDGSVITGQTTFTRANGTTGTVANTSLVAEAAGHRVEETVGTDSGIKRVVRRMASLAQRPKAGARRFAPLDLAA